MITMNKTNNINVKLLDIFDNMTIEEKYGRMLKDMRRLNRYCTKLEMQRDELKKKCDMLEEENQWLKLGHEPNEEKILNIASHFVTWLRKRELIETNKELKKIKDIKELCRQFRDKMNARNINTKIYNYDK